MQSNDHLTLTPRLEFPTPFLTFDFPSIKIGVAEYAEGPTGCTVFHLPHGAITAVDVRGGSPGIIGENYSEPNAVCFAGGSLYGLEAANGVAAELFAQNQHSTAFEKIALVSGAIIYDFAGRKNAIYPDKALGRAALRAAKSGLFPLGACGAGVSATVGNGFDFMMGEPSGQGGAFRQFNATKVAVFTVVNAIGAIVDRSGNVVYGHLHRPSGKRYHAIADLERRFASNEQVNPQPGNTTPTIVITNQKVSHYELRQLGRQVHASMGRAIQPFHTMFDGDVLFAVSTNEVENPDLHVTALATLAGEVAWDAVLSVAKALKTDDK
jgi:6-aminohexanoate-oligomer endohydrolase